MAGLKPLVSPRKLKTQYLASLSEQIAFNFFFDEEADELMLMMTSPGTETTVHYLDDNVGVLFNPNTLEIVGLQVDDFLSTFVPKYENLKKVWSLSNKKEIKMENVADLKLALKEQEILVALEVVRASRPKLGRKAKNIERALEYA